MTDIQENKLSAYEATVGILDANTTIWTPIAAFLALVNQLKAFITDIRSLRLAQEKDLKGVAVNKGAIRTDLVNAMFKVINGLVAHAIVIGDNELLHSVNYTLSDLKTCRDNILSDRANLIFTTAQPLQHDIAVYLVTEADVTLVDTHRKQFDGLLASPRIGTVGTKTTTADLKTKFKEIDDLLRNKMDKMVLIFRSANPVFVDQYFNARIIVDLGKRHSGTKTAVIFGTVVHFETLAPVEGATVRVVETGQTFTTDAQGNYKLNLSAGGTYTIQAEMSGFTTNTQDPITIEIGNSLQLDFELEPYE